MKNIILCATQRCGSTMICELMRNTLMLGLPEEYYIPWISTSITKYNWKVQQNEVYKKGLSPNGIFSVKIMSNQLEEICNKLETFIEVPKGLEKIQLLNILYNKEKTIWVRIIRKNTLKQAISRVMAQQTGVCHAVEKNSQDFFAGKVIDYNEKYNKNTRYDYNRIIQEVHKIKKEELLWNKFFKLNNIQPIRIIYENVIKNQKLPIIQITQALKLNINSIPEKEAQLRPLSNTLNSMWYKKALEDFYFKKSKEVYLTHDLKYLENFAKELYIHGSI